MANEHLSVKAGFVPQLHGVELVPPEISGPPNPGTYDANGRLLKSWEQLFDDGDLSYDETRRTLKANTKFEGVYKLVINGDNKYNNFSTRTFSGCALTEIVILDGITSLGNMLFYNCSNLTSITLPSTLRSTGGYTFGGCTKLASIVIPSGITSIDGNDFEDCTSLSSVTLPNGLVTIDYEAFMGCSSLTEITIPDTVTSIDGGAFIACTSLAKINYSGTATGYPWSAPLLEPETDYSGDKNLAPGTYDENNNLLKSWAKLIDDGDITIQEYPAYNQVSFGVSNNKYQALANVKKFIFDPSVTDIANYSFDSLDGLISVVLPANLTWIGQQAFWGCSGLESVMMFDKVTNIEKWAFRNCTKIKSITLPVSVSSIEAEAFLGCTSLTKIYYSGTATGAPWGATNATVVAA